MGFRRADGRVGTRNYVAVLASVNCSSSASAAVVDDIERSGVLDEYPERRRRDRLAAQGRLRRAHRLRSLHLFQRTLPASSTIPNVAGYVILSLGCEVNQPTT